MPPEILDLIFRLLDPPDLAKCVRVDQLWHNVGVPLLWRGSGRSPPLKYLHILHTNPTRLKHYVQHIKHLVIERSEVGILAKPQFIHQTKLWDPLRPSVVRINGLDRSPLPLPLYKPSLRALDFAPLVLSQADVSQLISILSVSLSPFSRECREEYIRTEFKIALQKCCPQLEYLRILAFHQRSSSGARHDISVGLKQLKALNYNISSARPEYDVYSGTIGGELFLSDQLRFLTLAGKRMSSELPAINFVHPLIYLHVSVIGTELLRPLLLRLKNLESLKIGFGQSRMQEYCDIKRDVFMPIMEACSKLEYLTLSDIDDSMNFDEECMGMLARSNVLLRSLSLKSRRDRDEYTSIRSATVTAFTAATPSLLTLELGDKFTLSAETLVSIGQHCPDISHIRVESRIDLVQLCDILQARPESLRKLRYLYSEKWLFHGRPFLSLEDERGQGRELALAVKCREYMPDLRELSSYGPDDNDYEDFGDVHNPEYALNRFFQTGEYDEEEEGDYYRSEDHTINLQKQFGLELDREIFSSVV